MLLEPVPLLSPLFGEANNLASVRVPLPTRCGKTPFRSTGRGTGRVSFVLAHVQGVPVAVF